MTTVYRYYGANESFLWKARTWGTFAFAASDADRYSEPSFPHRSTHQRQRERRRRAAHGLADGAAGESGSRIAQRGGDLSAIAQFARYPFEATARRRTHRRHRLYVLSNSLTAYSSEFTNKTQTYS